MLAYKNIFIIILLVAELASEGIFAQKFNYSASQIEKIKLANETLKTAIPKKDSAQIAGAYYTIGRHEGEAGNFLASYKFYLKSLKILETKEDSYELGRIYYRLFGNEYLQGHYPQSSNFLQTAITIYQKIKSDYGLSQAYPAYADFFIPDSISKKSLYFKPSYDSALYYYKKGEYYSKKIKDTVALAVVQSRLAMIYQNQLNPIAIPYFQSVLKIFSKRKDTRTVIHTLLALASAYIVFKEPQKAYPNILKAQHLYRTHYLNEHQTQTSLERTYVKYFQAVGNWQEAFNHLKNLNNLEKNESIADNKGAVSRLYIEFETKKKETQLEKQQIEIKLKDKYLSIQRYFLWVVTLFLAILSILSYFLYKNYQKQRILSQRNALLIQEQNHRVKNNLQVISSLLNLQAKHLKDKKSKAIFSESQLRLESMVLLHRQLYENDNVESINIEELLHDVANSVALTFGFYDIEISFKIQAKLLKIDTAISVGLIINELIINSFKHSFINKEPKIEISSERKGNNVEITYKDFGTENLELIITANTRKSFGLKLIDMLLFQINGTLKYYYSDGSSFIISFQNV